MVLFFKMENEKHPDPHGFGFMIFIPLYSYWTAFTRYF